jgi:flagellar motility protein MotE (MotC chaperone)
MVLMSKGLKDILAKMTAKKAKELDIIVSSVIW